MNAVWLQNNKLSIRKDVPVPAPSADEALIRVRLAGICGTDLEMVKGYYPFAGIPGHEFVGEIITAPRQPERVGQRIVGEINITCGMCPTCLAGRPTHCEKRSVLGIKDRNGAFAEFICLPLKNLIPVADWVADDAAVFVEPLAAAMEIQEQIKIRPDDRVLLLGAGRLGQLIAQTLAVSNCHLQVVARYAKQRQVLDERNISLLDEALVPRRSYDIVIEATGSARGFVAALRAVRPRGMIVLKSTYAGELKLNFSSLVVDEITLVGSRCGPFAPALGLIENGRVDPTVLIEERYSLQDAIAAFEHATRPGSLKILLQND